MRTLVLLLLVFGSELAWARQPVERPNVLFILADDLGWGDLSCYGHRQLKTPWLDRLATQGMLFTQFYVNGSVCSPSRCAFMTGQYPARHRIHGHFASHELNARRGMSNWLDPEVPNVAALFKTAGYATAHFGKWHLGAGLGAPDPTAYGFDQARTMVSVNPGWSEPPDQFWPKSTRLLVDETLRFIRANKDRPFYVNLWTLLPHATLNPTEEQMRPYNHLNPGSGIRHKGAEAIYYASVGDLDEQIGRLLEGLEELGLADETLVIFSSDNGPEDIHIVNAGHSGVGSAGPFRGRKRSLYEGGIRVPFIVRWPSHVPAGRVEDRSVVAGVDFLPTMCSLAGIQPPASHPLDGEDMSDVLLGSARPRRTPLMWEWRFNIPGEPFHRSPMLAIRESDWKLLTNPDRSRTELYDIPSDPTQLNNLAERRQDLVEQLAAKVLAWHRSLPEGPIEASAGRDNYPWPGRKTVPALAPRSGTTRQP
ncbi:MAG: sulfatase-like hydrolase/transferase [Phycisphaerae bacterium]|nr:sulfatase-like hydrolase/transferase [Phycisphaerae bacterium]